MFSSELERTRHPLSGRVAGIVLGSILLVAVAASLVSARTVAFTFCATTAGFLIAAALRGELSLARLRPGPVARYLAAFLLFALLSVAWADSPEMPLEKATLALLVAASTMAMMSIVGQEERRNLLHMGEGLWMGLLIGLLYLLAELLTDQSIKLALFRGLHLGPRDLNPASFFTWKGNYLVSISREDLTRNMTPAALLLWPTVMVIRASWQGAWRTAGAVGLVLLTGLVVMLSGHESSKLALVIGLATFAIARVSLRWTGRLAAAAWIIACLGVAPLVLFAYRMDLHHASWIQESARHRIIIWNYTAEKMLESPLVGIGANMTYLLGPELEKETPSVRSETLPRTLSIHSHSVYLQTWFELGVVGAALLTLFGLALLNAIGAIAPTLQPYAYATFASAAAMASASYGMWQFWYMALFGFCAVAFSIGARLLEQRNGNLSA